jgi:hypothetical protein
MPINDDKEFNSFTGAEPFHATGRFYGTPFINVLTTFAASANVLYSIPLLVPYNRTYTTIGIEVTTLAASTNARLGIYKDKYLESGATEGGYPRELVLDAGTVDCSTTGAKTITISQALTAGWYWLALVANGAPTFRANSQSTALPFLGFTSGTDVVIYVGWSVAFTYGTLPSPFTGGGALMNSATPRLMISP